MKSDIFVCDYFRQCLENVRKCFLIQKFNKYFLCFKFLFCLSHVQIINLSRLFCCELWDDIQKMICIFYMWLTNCSKPIYYFSSKHFLEILMWSQLRTYHRTLNYQLTCNILKSWGWQRSQHHLTDDQRTRR